MIINKINISILHLILFICISITPLKSLAGLVSTSGQSLITSSSNVEEYRQRAIENALQNIINNKQLYLNSFSVVENGQVLFDQIQSSSKAGILSYEVVNEYIKDNIYNVELEAIVNEGVETTQEERCRNTKISQVDFNISLSGNTLKLPAWFSLSNEWLEKEIKKQKFSYSLNFVTKQNAKKSSADPYRLFEPENNVAYDQNPYELNIIASYNLLKKDYILLKNEFLELSTQATIFRFGKPILIQKDKKQFRMGQIFGVNLPVTASRNLWDQSKKDLLVALYEDVQSFLDELNCVNIEPKLKVEGSSNYISFGEKDGIKSDDIFVVASNDPKKLYFKVTRISDHRTELELISKSQKVKDLMGQRLELVEGL